MPDSYQHQFSGSFSHLKVLYCWHIGVIYDNSFLYLFISKFRIHNRSTIRRYVAAEVQQISLRNPKYNHSQNKYQRLI
jgi:hypothetical protein